MAGLRERKKRQTREAIAKTALGLFAERGYDAVTVADVAEAAQVAVTTVFNYFKTKEDLFFGAFTPPTEILAERLRERAPGVGPVAVVRTLLLEALERMSEWAADDPHTRIHQTLAASPSLQLQAMQRFRARRFATMNEVASALTAPEPPDAFATLVSGQLLALVDATLLEAERRRRLAEAAGAMRPAVERACAALARGLEDYAVR